MKAKTFPLLLLALIFLIHKCLSLNPNYVACEPFLCGKLKISYPFFAPQKQPPNCGFRGFNVTCNRESQTIIHLSGDDYIINNISYQDLTINVTNSFFDQYCHGSLHNLTFGPDSKFNFTTHTQTDLLLLQNCSGIAKNYTKIKCRNINNTLLAVYEKDFLQEHVGNCGETVEVPYERANNNDIEGQVRKGITLNYIANNCSVCQNSGGRCGFSRNTSEFFCFCPDRDHSGSCKPPQQQQTNDNTKPNVGKHLAIILRSVLLGSIAIILALIIYRRQRKNKSDSSTRSLSFTHIKSHLEVGNMNGVTIFSYTQLEEATNNFDTSKQLGEGGFGIVYYGKLRDGREVAVKRLYEKSYKRIQQFKNEIKILTDLRHQNLVTLYGCTCHQSRELLLVYEYIPNGTVADHLHGQQSEKQILPWSTRIRIAIETATALYYLHYKDIIHRDVKTNNILLDNSFSVKVADFGLSRLLPADVTHVSTAPQGTPGYVDPEYYQCYHLTDKSDVYSFGVVLIELISSLPAVDVGRERNEINLSNYAMKRIQSCAVAELVDTNLGFETDLKVARMITLVAEVAYRCLQNERELRPSMEEVLQALKRIQSEDDDNGNVELLRQPWKPPASPVSVMDNCLNTSKSTTSTTSKSS